MKVAELPPHLLTYWVAGALSLPVAMEHGDVVWTRAVPAEFAARVGWVLEPGEVRRLDFVGDRALGHSIVEWIGISLERPSPGQAQRLWRAVTDWRRKTTPHQWHGPAAEQGETALIAAMRALVAATFGRAVPEMN